MKKIDMHVHSILKKGVERLNGGGWFTTPDELRAMYDQLGIEKGVQLPVHAPEWGTHLITNEESYELATRFPETYYWFCNVDPRWGNNTPTCDLSHFLLYYKNLGAKGVGEITSNLYVNDPMMENLFFHCEKCGMPVLFHIGNKGGDYGMVDDLHLPRLERALGKFPKLLFIGHSQKFWAEISGDCTEELRAGYPKGPVRPGGRVVELMRKHENLHADLSAGSGCNAVMRDPDFGYKFIEEFQDKLYFGTDICDPRNITNPMLRLSGWLDEGVEQGRISRAAYERVCRLNALKVLEG